jgi:hypothetical protein
LRKPLGHRQADQEDREKRYDEHPQQGHHGRLAARWPVVRPHHQGGEEGEEDRSRALAGAYSPCGSAQMIRIAITTGAHVKGIIRAGASAAK